MTRIFRVCRAVHSQLDGAGAHQVGGRWNSPGRPLVYMAQSTSLAVLENLVHMCREDFPAHYVEIQAAIPADLTILTPKQAGGLHDATREIGDRWLRSLDSAVLMVRSAVVPAEFNFLLNPLHPDFHRIEIAQPIPFLFDPRLFPVPAPGADLSSVPV